MVCLTSAGPPPGKPALSPRPSARLMRCQRQPGMYTHKSRGKDNIVTEGTLGSMLASIRTSVRHAPSPGRRSLPIRTMLIACGPKSRSGAGCGASSVKAATVGAAVTTIERAVGVGVIVGDGATESVTSGAIVGAASVVAGVVAVTATTAVGVLKAIAAARCGMPAAPTVPSDTPARIPKRLKDRKS